MKVNCKVLGGFMKYLTEPFKIVKFKDHFFDIVGQIIKSPLSTHGFELLANFIHFHYEHFADKFEGFH